MWRDCVEKVVWRGHSCPRNLTTSKTVKVRARPHFNVQSSTLKERPMTESPTGNSTAYTSSAAANSTPAPLSDDARPSE